eukprot:m.101467 g.101467  ORF g.101467 m.101467 type:complete len:96 (+) comp10392_c0_seq2:161-448(+)
MAKGSDDSTQSAKRQKTSDGSSGGSVLKFRNYVPSGDELADAVMAPAPEMPSIDKEVQAAHAKVSSLIASSGQVHTCYLLSVFVLSHARMLKSIQ